MHIISTRNKLHLGENWVAGQQEWEGQLFFTVFQFVTLEFCTIQDILINEKAKKKCRFFSLTQDPQNHILWGRSQGLCNFNKHRVRFSCTKFEEPWQTASLVMHTYQNNNTNSDVSSNEHLFNKTKLKTPLPKSCTSFPEKILWHNEA